MKLIFSLFILVFAFTLSVNAQCKDDGNCCSKNKNKTMEQSNLDQKSGQTTENKEIKIVEVTNNNGETVKTTKVEKDGVAEVNKMEKMKDGKCNKEKCNDAECDSERGMTVKHEMKKMDKKEK